ncbi:MAG: hypothetical protein JSS82_14005 [Bacteroidetes bacterium]|nr:hypothetical protein [Bacteroidota bacterium]
MVSKIVGTPVSYWHGISKDKIFKESEDYKNSFELQHSVEHVPIVGRRRLDLANGRFYKYNDMMYEKPPEPIGKITEAWLDDLGCIMCRFILEPSALGILEASKIANAIRPDVSLSIVVSADVQSDGSIRFGFDPHHLSICKYGRKAGTHIISAECSGPGVPENFSFENRDPSRPKTGVSVYNRIPSTANSMTSNAKTDQENTGTVLEDVMNTVSATTDMSSTQVPMDSAPAAPQPAAQTGESVPAKTDAPAAPTTNPTEAPVNPFSFANDETPRNEERMHWIKVVKELKTTNNALASKVSDLQSAVSNQQASQAQSLEQALEAVLANPDNINMATTYAGVSEEEYNNQVGCFREALKSGGVLEKAQAPLMVLMQNSHNEQKKAMELLQKAQNVIDERQQQQVTSELANLMQLWNAKPDSSSKRSGVMAMTFNSMPVNKPAPAVQQPQQQQTQLPPQVSKIPGFSEEVMNLAAFFAGSA